MNHLDLFSGIGGFALAAQWAGHTTVGFCEIEPYAQQVLKKNFPSVPVFPDISKLKRNDIHETIDIATGGFPCQPFSVAGRKKGTKDDRDLWPEMLRVIQEFQPTWVIGENVANFVSMAFQRTKTDLESEGYEVQPFVIPACGVGAPHRRDRVWIVAYSDSHRRSKGDRSNSRADGTRENTHRKWTSNSNKSGCASASMADANSYGRQGQWAKQHNEEPARLCHRKAERDPNQWAVEPDVGRVANGIPNRVDRLKGLGNAIVPQVAYQILMAINDSNHA